MSWDNDYRVLVAAMRDAGDTALRAARDGFQIHTKADQSPVTSADHAVNEILQDRLLGAFPEDGWLSEESPDTNARLTRSRVWIIDPIDGTKAFIRREPEFCISVALIEDGRPVLAAIFNPSTDELYTAQRGQGLRLNDKPRSTPVQSPAPHPIMALSPHELRLGRFTSVEAHLAPRPMLSIAWAIALTASGAIHGVMTFEPENEWDVAAGALLIEEAGGVVRDVAGQPLRFNQSTPRYDGFLAMAAGFPDTLASQLFTLPRPAR